MTIRLHHTTVDGIGFDASVRYANRGRIIDACAHRASFHPTENTMPTWIRTTIAEPFPVMYSHASQKNRRAGESEGPHYVAGAAWFEPFSPATLAWKERSAAMLRKDGYTVTVDVVTGATHSL